MDPPSDIMHIIPQWPPSGHMGFPNMSELLDSATVTAASSPNAQMPRPMEAITNMLEDSSLLLVDYFSVTETDPAKVMCDSDKLKLGKVVHMLRQFARPAGSPADFPLPSLFPCSSVGLASPSSRVVNNPDPSFSPRQPQPVPAQQNIPSWVIVPPGSVVPPATPANFASINIASSTGNLPKSNHTSSSSSSAQQRAVWTKSNYNLLLSQVAKYGCRFRHIYDLHGPNGTESRQLADYTVTQLTAKWHRGLARMSAEEAAKWTAKAARAGETFDAERAAAAVAAAASSKGLKLWNDDEFQFLCQQVAKHGTQFKRIWVEHGPEGTLSKTLARFTTTQLQAKWHNAKKLRPELENLVPTIPVSTPDETDADPSASLLSNRWTLEEFSFLCQQVAKHGTQFKHIHELHGPNGQESQTLARFTLTQLHTKWHNAKKHKTEAELLAPFHTSLLPNQSQRSKRSRGSRGIWSPDEIEFLCDQVVAHGGHSSLSKIWELHGPEGTVSRRLARFSLKQVRFKWYNELRGSNPRMVEVKRLLAEKAGAEEDAHGEGPVQGETEDVEELVDDNDEDMTDIEYGAPASQEGDAPSPSKRPRLDDAGEMMSEGRQLEENAEGDTSV